MRQSESIAALAAALKEFQANVGNIPKTATNPHFKSKFAPLDAIVAVINQKGPEYGLSHFQSVGSVGVVTRLMHESGEWVESDPLNLTPDKATPQGEGSAITYARRYQLPAMYGLASEEDDDGNGAEEQTKPQARRETPAPAKPQAEAEPMGWEAVVKAYRDHGTKDAVLKSLGNPADAAAALDVWNGLSDGRKAEVSLIAVGAKTK